MHFDPGVWKVEAAMSNFEKMSRISSPWRKYGSVLVTLCRKSTEVRMECIETGDSGRRLGHRLPDGDIFQSDDLFARDSLLFLQLCGQLSLLPSRQHQSLKPSKENILR